MNSAAMAAGVLHPDARRALAMLAACGERSLRRLLLGVYTLAALAAAAAFTWIPKPDKATGLAVALLAIATAFVWLFWLSRVVLLAIDARASRMPDLQRDALAALALAFAATVALPTLVLAAAGADSSLAFAALACTALLGLLFAWLPGWMAIGMCFMPMLVQGLELSPLQDFFTAPRMELLALAAGLLAVLRWRAILRGPQWPTGPSLTQPLVIGLGRQAMLGDGMLAGGDINRRIAATPQWLLEAGQVAAYGPHAPVPAMRAWLGSPFASMTWPHRFRQLAIVLGSAALFPLAISSISDDPGAFWAMALAWVGIFGGMMLAVMFPLRLAALTRRNAGELAELAVLPGWGGIEQARRTLLRAVAGPPVIAFSGLLVLLLIIAPLAGGMDRAGYALILVSMVGLVLMTAVGSLRPLAGQPLSLRWLLAFCLLGLPLLLVSVFAVVGRFRELGGIDWAFWLFVAWALVDAFLAVCLAAAWRRFNARPHPFLQH